MNTSKILTCGSLILLLSASQAFAQAPSDSLKGESNYRLESLTQL